MLSDKKFEKIKKALGKDMIQELDKLSVDELKSRIVMAEESVKTAIEGLETNTKYQALKTDISMFNKGLGEVKKRQNSIVRYSLHLLEEKGK